MPSSDWRGPGSRRNGAKGAESNCRRAGGRQQATHTAGSPKNPQGHSARDSCGQQPLRPRKTPRHATTRVPAAGQRPCSRHSLTTAAPLAPRLPRRAQAQRARARPAARTASRGDPSNSVHASGVEAWHLRSRQRRSAAQAPSGPRAKHRRGTEAGSPVERPRDRLSGPTKRTPAKRPSGTAASNREGPPNHGTTVPEATANRRNPVTKKRSSWKRPSPEETQ